MPYYGQFRYFTNLFVGPFDTVEQADAHAAWCRERQSDVTYCGAVMLPPHGARIVTPEENRAWVSLPAAATS